MEGFRIENTNEAFKPGKIILENKKIQEAMAGKPVEAGIKELIKIFTICDRVVNSGEITEEKAGEMILDLFDELDVRIFEPEQIFSKKVLNQLLGLSGIESLSVQINDGMVEIKRDMKIDSIISRWEESLDDIPIIDSKEIATNQEEVDKLYKSLKGLNFNSLDAIIKWLNAYNRSIEEIGVSNHIKDVVKIFKEKGYNKQDNDIVDFTLGETLQDKKRYGKAMVGYMLTNLGVFESTQMDDWIADWKQM